MKLTSDIARKILAAKDALVENNYNEAYHQLYAIASPNFDKHDPWKELKLIAHRPANNAI